MKKQTKTAVAAIFTAACLVFSMPATCLAKVAYWQLRYVKGGPASVQVENWSKTVTTTQTTTLISATAIENGAQIEVYTDNGIFAKFSSPSAASVDTRKGKEVYAYVKFINHGTAYNRPAGRLTY